MHFNKAQSGKNVVFLGAFYGLLHVLMALMLNGCALMHPSVEAEYLETIEQGPYEALVIPGFPAEKGEWNRVIRARIYWAKHLYESGVVKNIIFSGAATRTPYAEGQLMALYALAVGIPKDVIFIEPLSQHTCENLYYSYRLAQRLGFHKLAVCSDPIQMKSIRKHCKSFNLPYGFLPVDFVTLFWMNKPNPKIDPTLAFVEGFVPIDERYSKEEIKAFSDGKRVREAMAQQVP